MCVCVGSTGLLQDQMQELGEQLVCGLADAVMRRQLILQLGHLHVVPVTETIDWVCALALIDAWMTNLIRQACNTQG